MKILVLNAGSSSQKSCLYNLEQLINGLSPEPIWQSVVDWQEQTITSTTAHAKVKLASSADRVAATKQMLGMLYRGKTKVIETFAEIDIVGHRIVHGGDYRESILIDPTVKEVIRSLIPLSPNHNPAHLEGIEIVESLLGNIPQIAVFDTAFHTTQPPEIAAYPIPYELYLSGIKRYGFHGLSHRYCSQKASQILNLPPDNLRIINCHLGNGCSLAAIKNGISIQTTMGFTPLEGLMMGSRSGSIDPAIVLYLIREKGFSVSEVDQMLNNSSGLLGVSGVSADLRDVLNSIKQGNQRSQLALSMYIHSIRANIASLLPNLGGLDTLIFTAGVGENSALIREKVCQGLQFLGLELDLTKNLVITNDTIISTLDSRVNVLVIHTQEDWIIAQDCWNWSLKNL